MDLWIKIALVAIMGIFVYREILKSAAKPSHQATAQKNKAGLLSFVGIGAAVSGFVYVGMSITLIETRDLRPYLPSSPMVSLYDRGVIKLNGMVIKTNLARNGELTSLANELTLGCNKNDACEAQKMFDYITRIPYKTDYSSRAPKEVIATNWGDCDDKSNFYASLLNERGIDYRFVYVLNHVFVVVHIKHVSTLPFVRAKLTIDNQDYYYAETTATGASIGQHNGQFPYNFIGIYDIKNKKEVDLKKVSFGII